MVTTINKQLMKGRGYSIENIWLIGLNRKTLECQKTSMMFIINVLTKKLVISDNIEPVQGKYQWVKARI